MLENKLGGTLKKTLAAGVVATMMAFGSVSYGAETDHKPIVYVMNVPVNSDLSEIERARLFDRKILENYHYFDNEINYVFQEEQEREYIPKILEINF